MMRMSNRLLLGALSVAIFALSTEKTNAQIPTRHMHILVHVFIGTPDPNNEYFSKTFSGRWLIKAPNIPMNIGQLPIGCFTTDNRRFSTSPTASARFTFEADLVLTPSEMRVEKFDGRDLVRIGETRNQRCANGEDLRPPRRASLETVKITPVKAVDERGFVKSFKVEARPSDPFYDLYGINVAPSLKFDLLVSFDSFKQRLRIGGAHIPFPWAEGYYSLNGAPPVAFLQFAPDPTTSPLALAEPLVYAQENIFQPKDILLPTR